MFERLKEFFALERNIAVLGLTGIFWMFNWGLWWQFLPKYFGVVTNDIILVGALLSAYYAFLALFHAFGGYLSDIYGRKRIIVLAFPLGIAGLISYFLADSWVLLVPGIIFIALSVGIRKTADATLVTESLHKKKMATGRGTIDVIEIASMSVASVLGGFLINEMGLLDGFRLSLLIGSVMVFIAALVAARMLRETLHKKRRTAKFNLSPGMMTRFFKKLPAQVKFLILTNSISLFSWSIIINYMVFYAIDIVKITPLEWGIVYGTHLASYAFFSFLGAKFSDNYGRKMAVLVLFVSASLLPIFFILSTNFFTMLLVGIFWGLFGFGTSSMAAFTADHTPKISRGRSVGIANSIFAFSTIPGPVIGGLLFAAGPQFPFIVSGLIGAVAVFMGWKLLK